jgi:hypothetical protein
MIPAPALIDLEAPDSWPEDLRDYLDRHHSLFLDWETGPSRVRAAEYDRAVYGLQDVLRQYELVGWHCTRLTEAEIAAIESGGMQLPDSAMLDRRLETLCGDGLISPASAQRLKAKNQAHEPSRAGMVWFCFFPPRLAGEWGIGSFFRNWGGEALYNSHEDDAETGAVIRAIGTPCLVEAFVPIASLEVYGGLYSKVVRRFLISRGHLTREPVDHEDRVKCPLPATNIRRIIVFPTPDFVALTGCDEWEIPLNHSSVAGAQ